MPFPTPLAARHGGGGITSQCPGRIEEAWGAMLDDCIKAMHCAGASTGVPVHTTGQVS